MSGVYLSGSVACDNYLVVDSDSSASGCKLTKVMWTRPGDERDRFPEVL